MKEEKAICPKCLHLVEEEKELDYPYYCPTCDKNLYGFEVKSVKELCSLDKYVEIDLELLRAKRKHPKFPEDMFHQLAIMQEEAGEVTKAVLQYKYEGGSFEDIKSELIQTAAMCMRMLENLK